MRFFLFLVSLFLLMACDPKNNTTSTTTPPTVNERVGIYKNATIYTGRSDYEFEIDGQSMLFRMSNFDTLNQPAIPSNLTVADIDGFPVANPLLIGQKYTLAFAPQEQLKSIQLFGPPDPSNAELPALPDNYSGLLAVGPSENSRAYLNLAADLRAVLLINYDKNERPMYKYGRWTRTNNGQKVSIQFEEEDWEFLVRKNILTLASGQMGKAGLNLRATEFSDICQYVQQWLSNLSTIDGESPIVLDNIDYHSPLAEILKTEHAYMALYGELESVYKIEETTISKTLRANPTVQGVCDLILRATDEGH
ncbi:MAG: hypothetical protein AB8G86_18590 [Saprospiraceae bacterium]